MLRSTTSLGLLALACLTGCKADVDCQKTITVNSQKDLDAISSCKTFGADIRIGRDASGDLAIRGITSLKGYLINDICESCSTKAAQITSISSSTELSTIDMVQLAGLEKLEKIRFPSLRTSFILDLRNLTSLQAFESESMNKLQDLILENLPKLTTFRINETSFRSGAHWQYQGSRNDAQLRGGIRIQNVGLESLDMLFNQPFNSYVLQRSDNISIAGIPNVNSLNINLPVADHLYVQGNGDLSVVFTSTDIDYRYLRHWDRFLSISLTGISSVLRQGPSDPKNWTYGIDSLSIQDSNIEKLDLFFTKLQHLSIVRNPRLQYIGTAFVGVYGMKTVEIGGNGNLRLNNSYYPGPIMVNYTTEGHDNSTWVWPPLGMNSMFIDGPILESFL